MERVTSTAHARAGLLGNPSDGYGGKAIGLCLDDLRAQVHIEPAQALGFVASDGAQSTFTSLLEARGRLGSANLGDGIPLLLAALNRFCLAHPEFEARDPSDPGLRFTLRFETNIPRQVGLAGSSAIVIAALRGMARWFKVDLTATSLAKLALEAETDDLGIAAGPMDRIVQAHEGLIVMDLAQPGNFLACQSLDPNTLPPLFLAWHPQGGQPSGEIHAPLRQRWQAGDPEVMRTMKAFRDLVDEGLGFLGRADHAGFREAMNRNFELRRTLLPIAPSDLEMVKIATQHRASAKLSGSGGAVVGAMASEADFERIEKAYRGAGYEFLRPRAKLALGERDE
ncbi:MAG: hypothetical protein OSB70_09150 [Myxococcota bacterium]|nr:hypothetical protein [Myxococcota bacterium]